MRGDACRNVHDKQTVIIYIYTSTQLVFLSGQIDGMSQPAIATVETAVSLQMSFFEQEYDSISDKEIFAI